MIVSSVSPVVLLVCWLGPSAAFLTPRPARFSLSTSSSTETTNRPTATDVDDVDARVLQSLLQDNKLDADDVRRVMEQKKQQQTTAVEESTEESQYSSQLLQKLADTKLFRKLSVQASEFLETTQLRVLNTLEQNLGVVLAMTATIWDRATYSVARALPATRTNTTSTTTATTPTRLLTSAAPAGRAGAATRAQRAYTAAKQNAKPKAPNVMNTAYQVQKELQAETSTPGYKTEPARQAIKAAAVSAYRIAGLAAPSLLKGAEQRKELAGAEEQDFDEPVTISSSFDEEPTMASTAVVDTDDAVVVDSFSVSTASDESFFAATLDEDDTLFRQRLDACITDPQATWLTPDVAQALPQIDYCVQETVALLTRARASSDPMSRSALEQVCTDVASRTSKVAGEALEDYLLMGTTKSVASVLEDVPQAVVVEEEPIMVIADAQVENYVQQQTATTTTQELIEDDASYTSVAASVVEVLADDEDVMTDDDALPNTVRHVDDEPVAKEENALSTLALRTLDVLFLLVEKIVVVGVPRTITMGQTAIKRIEGVKRQGQGTKGWTPVSSVKGRY